MTNQKLITIIAASVLTSAMSLSYAASHSEKKMMDEGMMEKSKTMMDGEMKKMEKPMAEGEAMMKEGETMMGEKMEKMDGQMKEGEAMMDGEMKKKKDAMMGSN